MIKKTGILVLDILNLLGLIYDEHKDTFDCVFGAIGSIILLAMCGVMLCLGYA